MFALSVNSNLHQTSRIIAHACISPHVHGCARITSFHFARKITTAPSPTPLLLRTLCPSNIAQSGQEIIDLSGNTGMGISVRVTHPRRPNSSGRLVVLHKRVDELRAKFPDKTRGFLYYHPEHRPLASSIRFRLCESAAEFDAGRDLELSTGLWQIQLLDLTHLGYLRGFIPLLLKENLVEEALLTDALNIRPSEHPKRQRFYSFSDPFLFNPKTAGPRMNSITRKGAHEHRFSNMCEDVRGEHLFPYTGRIWARFEISKMPEHAAKGPCLLLKCLETVEPVKCVIPGYDGYIHPPEPGEYVIRKGRPWYYRLMREEERFRDMMEQEGVYPSAEERKHIVLPRS